MSKKVESKKLLCFSRQRHGISVCYILPQVKKIQGCEFLIGSDQKQLLADYIEKYDLAHSECACVLQPYDYRLLLLDAPKVPPDEFKQATRWMIKDLINYPVEEAVIDTFAAPQIAGQAARIYAVVSRLNLLQQIEKLTSDVNLQLVSIDIAELALRNLVCLTDSSMPGAMLTFVNDDGISILIIKDKIIYLSRQFSILAKKLNLENKDQDSAQYDSLIVELQRSLEFYQSQMKQSIPQELLLDPKLAANEVLVAQLASSLDMKVNKLTATPFVDDLSVDLLFHGFSVIGEAVGQLGGCND